jgi:hypothetical protein
MVQDGRQLRETLKLSRPVAIKRYNYDRAISLVRFEHGIGRGSAVSGLSFHSLVFVKKERAWFGDELDGYAFITLAFSPDNPFKRSHFLKSYISIPFQTELR